MDKSKTVVSVSPDKTFELGEELGPQLKGGDVILLTGGLGAGKTLFTKGVLSALAYDIDEVTSPSFTLVNLYKAAPFDVYHIDLWRTQPGEDAAFAIGLDEILEEGSAVKIIEWAERLGQFQFDSLVYSIDITGDGDEPRTIKIEVRERYAAKNV